MFLTLRLGDNSPWDKDAFLVLSLLDIARYIDATWEDILRILRMAKEEDDMLAICHGEG